MLALFALVACGASDKDKNGNLPWEVAMKGSQYLVQGNKKALWNLLTEKEKETNNIVNPSETGSGEIKSDKDYRIVEYKDPKDPAIRYYAISHTVTLGRVTDYSKVVKQNDVWKIDNFIMNEQDFMLATEGIKGQKIDLTKGE